MKKLTLFVLAIVFCMVYLVTACYAMDDNSFVQLCGSGSVQAVRNALLQGANPNAKNNEGSSWFGIMLEWFVSPPPGVHRLTLKAFELPFVSDAVDIRFHGPPYIDKGLCLCHSSVVGVT